MKIIFIILITLAVCLGAPAQPVPHVAYVYPAGGRVGTTFQIVVGGQSLLTVSNAVFSGSGIQATVLERSRPMNQKEFSELRDRFTQLQEKFQAARGNNSSTNTWTAADNREREEIRNKILKNPPNRKANPAMLDTTIVQVSIATNASRGEHEIRLVTANAVSNPLKFLVGDLPEISKTAAKPANPDLDRFLVRLGRQPTPPGTPKYERNVSLPATINGQIMPGGVDRYRFIASRGQQLVIAASARALIPYLADAVPGWFEATVKIYDPQGKQLASGERFHLKPDPVIHFEVPQNGEYVVEIHDSIYRGREDFVYRLTMGELPYVTSIFPLGGLRGQRTSVALNGWNLKQSILEFEGTNGQTGITFLSGGFFNLVPFAVDDLPEYLARGSNQSSASAEVITLPTIVNGRINGPGECGVFKFEGRKNQQVVAEVMARRLNSPLDSFLRLTDAGGKQLAFNDDFDDKASGLETHHADSCLSASLPADGTYFISIGDVQGKGCPDFAYRLRISEPQPDFSLRMVPSSLNARAGMSVPVTMYAFRKDGFTNSIDLHLADASAGFSISGARIADNQEMVRFTLKVPPQSEGGITNLEIRGSAVIGGRTIIHNAVPAEDMMQAFAYRHLVPSHEAAVEIAPNPRPFAGNSIKVLSPTPIKIRAGAVTRVRIATPSAAFANRFNLEFSEAPDGISLVKVSPVENEIELLILADNEKVKVGTRGNLIVNLSPKNPAPALNQKVTAAGPARRLPASSLPAIPYQVVEVEPSQ